MTDTTIHLKSSQAAETRVEVETNKQKFPALSKRLEAARSFCVEVQQGVSKLQCKRKAHKVFSVKTLKNKLPILKWLPQYRLADLRGDLIAGLTLGLTVIPQSLAYARIAELPTQYGLYTSFMCYFVYCFMGTARDVNIGPAAVMSLLTAEFTHQIPQLAALLSLICGVSQLLMGLLNIGFIMEFISHTIINSFTTAAALAILFSQVKRWLGLQGVPRDFMRQLYYSIVKIPETQIFDFLMGLVCMLILFLLKKAKSMRLAKEASPALVSFLQFISTARNAITIFLASVFSAILYHQRIEPFTLTGNITSGVPPLHLPTLTVHLPDNTTLAGTDTFKMVGIGSVIAPLVGLIEVIAIAKAFGKKNGYKVDSTQEFISLGVSNILGSFVSAYPVTGSFSRSAVAAQSGIRTPAANIVTGILVLVALAFLTPIFFFIPTPALAAVIIMAVTDLIDFSMLHQLWTINKADLVPWFVTFFVSLLFGFEYGILLGVAVSLLFLIYPWTKSTIKIHPVEARFADLDNFQDIGARKKARVVVVEPTFGLLFPGAEVFEERIFKHVTTGDCIIIDFNHIWKLDYSAATTLSHLAKDLAHKNIKYVFINLHEKVERKLPKVEKAGSLKSAIDFLRGKMEEENIEDADFKETNASNILEVSVECEVKTTSLGGAFDRQEMKEKNEADKEDEQKNDRMGDQAMEVRDPSVAPSKPSEAPSKPSEAPSKPPEALSKSSEAPSKPPEASRESYEAFRGFEGAVESKPFLPK